MSYRKDVRIHCVFANSTAPHTKSPPEPGRAFALSARPRRTLARDYLASIQRPGSLALSQICPLRAIAAALAMSLSFSEPPGA